MGVIEGDQQLVSSTRIATHLPCGNTHTHLVLHHDLADGGQELQQSQIVVYVLHERLVVVEIVIVKRPCYRAKKHVRTCRLEQRHVLGSRVRDAMHQAKKRTQVGLVQRRRGRELVDDQLDALGDHLENAGHQVARLNRRGESEELDDCVELIDLRGQVALEICRHRMGS